MFCPKLDGDTCIYVEKLTDIFKNQNIKSITIIRMEVPCCGGVQSIVEDALRKADKNIEIKNFTISLEGKII